MSRSSKIMLTTLSVVGLSLMCCFCTCGGMGYRYFDAGVNPLREIKMATLGESIQIKEHGEPDGRLCRRLLIDEIDHGIQYTNAPGAKAKGIDWPRVPGSYYHTDGPVGMACSKFNWFLTENAWQGVSDARLPVSLIGSGASTTGPWPMLASALSEPPVGVIMMNNGALAAYARPLQTVDFYEASPGVLKLSLSKNRDERAFSFIEDAKSRGAHVRVLEGNERRTFAAQAPKNYYHLIVMDTSRGHPGLPSKELLTKEAWKLYLESLVEDGVICVHTSSRDYRLAEVVAATVGDLKLAHKVIHDGISDRDKGHYTSEWVVVARKLETLKYLEHAGQMAHQRLRGGQLRGEHEKVEFSQLPLRSELIFTDGGSNSLAPVRR